MVKGNMVTPARLYLKTMLLLTTMLSLCPSCNLLDPPVESGSVLFQDNFSRNNSGWDRYSNEKYLTDYDLDGYRIGVFTTETNVWARPHLDFGDTITQVLATKLDGPDDNVFGVLCRYQDAQNFYFFLVSSDGYCGIGINLNGEELLLSDEAMLPSDVINQGTSTNHIRADCIGHELSLYINGTLTAQAVASEWSRGDVGLIAGTYENPGTDILFESFSVLMP
jgi:hypothetical protein